MLFQLRNLSDRQYQLVMDAPILVGILLGSADGQLSERGVTRLVEVIKTKVITEKNDVHLLYKKLAEGDIAARVSQLVAKTGEFGSNEEKADYLTDQLTGLNKVFEKINHAYAVQYRDALHDIAIAVANSTGGILGVARISHDESQLIDLSFINRP
jgi:lysophospholipase L1-like esterase